MTMRLTPEQEAIVATALAQGLASSAENFVSEALRKQAAELGRKAEVDAWLRDVVVPAHHEFMKNPSGGVPARDLLATIRARRRSEEDG
ncbi:hypothetical protein [Aurantimonas sp. 22II-16-19i]|uniref:hypothetical protein n=1 Tax=Aurantimonas sp. 22II-16-19i TaxID=1317114 RepID=UPI0009F7AB56|nr:hypothetical protein [Aurantimonas sp. 22II-16-19i]ORE98483.1 hypothetical protein ATO4_03175 [Aurantimonas sp. 22II-16-19i]